jgi:hypothetical protein
MKIFFLIIIGFFLLASCDTGLKYKTELEEIQGYQLKLDSLSLDVNRIDLDSLVYMQTEAASNEKTIKALYSPDTIDALFAEKLNMNKGVRKSLISVNNQKENMLNEIGELKLQFVNLEVDILNGLYNQEQIVDYLNVEKLDFDILELSYKDFNLNQNKQKNNFYFANPQISEYVEMLLNEVEKP